MTNIVYLLLLIFWLILKWHDPCPLFSLSLRFKVCVFEVWKKQNSNIVKINKYITDQRSLYITRNIKVKQRQPKKTCWIMLAFAIGNDMAWMFKVKRNAGIRVVMVDNIILGIRKIGKH